MMKKIISMLLITTMLLGTLVGCKKQESNNGEKVTLTVGIPQNVNITDYDDNALTKYIEENLNIELEFQFFAGDPSEYMQQLALMCSSGDELPDVLWGFAGMSRRTMNQYGEDGYFMDLKDLIEEHAPNYKKRLESVSEEVADNIVSRGTNTTDGGFYGMPTYTESMVADYMQNIMFINQQWLDAVGMTAPTNVDELYNVLKAFKTQDPNGVNGGDELPMFSSGIWNYVINAYVYYNQTNPFNVTDGKIWSPVRTDEYRQALIFLNKLCKEGLLSELSLTATSADAKQLISGSGTVAKVGIWSGHPLSWTTTSSEVLDQYTALAELADETGKGGYGVQQPNYQVYGGFITKDCKNPEVAMKFFDFFYLDETAIRLRHGEKGVDWEEGSGVGIYGDDSIIQTINAQAFFDGNSTWGTTGTTWMTPQNNLAIAVKGTGRNAECSRLSRESQEVMLEFKKPEEVAVNLIYSEKDETTKENLEGVYGSYVAEARALFISGGMDPNNDADWQKYLDTLDQTGEPELIKAYQSAYNLTYKK